MALALVQVAPKASNNNASSLTIPLSYPTTLGNGIVVAVVANRTGGPYTLTCSDSRGHAYAVAAVQTTGDARVYLFYCPILTAGGMLSVVVSSPTNDWFHGTAFEISGVGSGLGVDQTASATGTSTAPATGSTPALTGSDVFAVAAMSVDLAQTSITVGSTSPAWVEAFEDITLSVACGEVDYRFLTGASGTTPSASWTNTASSQWDAAIATFVATSVTPPTETRIYLTNRAAPYTPATIRGTWNDTAGSVTKALDQSKEQGGVSAAVSRAEAVATNPYDVLLYRGISGPMAAQTLSGNLNVCIGVSESNIAADFNWHLHLYVTVGDSDTVRGTLINDYVEAAGVNEWPTTGTMIALNAAVALSSLAVSAGDRLVALLGVRARNTVTTSYTASLRYGSADAIGTGLAEGSVGNTAITLLAGYLTFDFVIAMQNSLRISQVPVQTASAQAATPSFRISQVVAQTISAQAVTPSLRISQVVVQTASGPLPAATVAVSQVVVETITVSPGAASASVSQVVVETISPGAKAIDARFSQVVVETISPHPGSSGGVSGVWLGDGGSVVWVE